MADRSFPKAEEALQVVARMAVAGRTQRETQLIWLAHGALFLTACDCAALDGNLAELVAEAKRLRQLATGDEVPTRGDVILVQDSTAPGDRS